MRDARLARRLRISNALGAVWLLFLCGVLAVATGDPLAGLLMLTLVSGGYGVSVLWMDVARLLPRGKLPRRHKSVLQVALATAAALGLVTIILLVEEARSVAGLLAAVAAAIAIGAGGFSVWLGVS
jgi:hypothetical protein